MGEIVQHTLLPVYDAHSKILILGTIPSPKSRETGFYYGHPQNRFWPVLANILQENIPQTNEEKTALIQKYGIALWDVLAQCEIDGAADQSIRKPKPNDLGEIFACANIRAVFATGQKAAALYRKYREKHWPEECIVLPSTSAANAKWSLQQLTEAYQVICPYLRDDA